MARQRRSGATERAFRMVLTVLSLLSAAAIVYCVAAQWIEGGLSRKALLATPVFVVGFVLLAIAYAVALAINRRARAATLVAVSVSAMIVITLAVSLDAGKYSSERADASFRKVNRLSDQTVRVIAGLPQKIEVTAYVYPQNDTQYLQMQRVKDLLDEYETSAKGRIEVRHVDGTDPEGAKTVIAQLQIRRLEPNTVVFTSGRGEDRRLREVGYAEMFRLSSMSTRPVFCAEEAFSSALIEVTRSGKSVVYFLGGHYERDASSFESEGYGPFAAYLERKAFTVAKQPLLLKETDAVPTDCAVLVVAGPEDPIDDEELRLIGEYLDGGGRALFMVEAMTESASLRRFLSRYNVIVGDDQVVEGGPSDGSIYSPVVSTYPAHEITRPLANTYTALYGAASVEVRKEDAEGLRGTVILTTSEKSWAETDLAAVRARQAPRFDYLPDRRGPIGLAAAAESPEDTSNLTIGSPVLTRIVVIGDADLADETALSDIRSNRNFLLNVMNWLRGEEQLISIPARSTEEPWLSLAGKDHKRIGLLTVAGLPMLAIVAGGLVLVIRSIRYS